MSGQVSSLQTLMRSKEARGLYVHCRGHNHSLVAQDSIEQHTQMRNIMNLAQSFISFARKSPKRLKCFNSFKLEDFENHSDNSAKQKAEAAGYLESFQKFDTFFKLENLRIIFSIVEDTNTALQGESSI